VRVTLGRWSSLVAVLAAALGACGGLGQGASAPPPSPAGAIRTTAASTLTGADVGTLADAFPDQPFTGGQKAPFVARWVTDTSFAFLQFDRPAAAASKAVAYVGVGVKGTFCAETRPDAAGGGFTRFQRSLAPSWTAGAGGRAGDQGYWLSFVAVDQLDVAGRSVPLGIDYRYPGPTPPSCGGAAAAPTFSPTGAGRLTPDAIARLFAVFTDQPLQGGQTAPRIFKAISDRALLFLQFDRNSATDARELRYLGFWTRSTYCASTQPSRDFTHFHRLVAPSYALGHGGPPGTAGFWGTWIAAEQFESQGRTVAPGVDREFSPTPPPSSC
jgi:hypothetical protein